MDHSGCYFSTVYTKAKMLCNTKCSWTEWAFVLVSKFNGLYLKITACHLPILTLKALIVVKKIFIKALWKTNITPVQMHPHNPINKTNKKFIFINCTSSHRVGHNIDEVSTDIQEKQV